MASKIDSIFKFEKRGSKMNLKARAEPSIPKLYNNNVTNRINKAGINNLLAFSIPPEIPLMTTVAVAILKNKLSINCNTLFSKKILK